MLTPAALIAIAVVYENGGGVERFRSHKRHDDAMLCALWMECQGAKQIGPFGVFSFKQAGCLDIFLIAHIVTVHLRYSNANRGGFELC